MSEKRPSGWDCWVVRKGGQPANVPPDNVELDVPWEAAEACASEIAEARRFSGNRTVDVWMSPGNTRDEPVVYRIQISTNIEIELWRLGQDRERDERTD